MARLLLQGEIPRSEIRDIANVKQRRATQIIKELLEAEIAWSKTAYGPLRLNLSVNMATLLFPELA